MAATKYKEVCGVALPANEKGERSSTSFGKDVMGAAVGASGDASLATAIEAERNWRYGYPEHFVKATETCIQTREIALAVSRAGLKKATESAEFVRDGASKPLSELQASPEAETFGTATVKGSGVPKKHIEMPYRGQVLSGDTLATQLDAFAAKGVLEKSGAEAAKASSSNSEWLDLTGHQFVVLGAGSELGPFEWLLNAGATVLAVGTRRPDRWAKHIAMARESAGTLLLPMAKDAATEGQTDEQLAASAGCDLAGDLPEVLAWILKNTEGSRPLTVGTYIYADGEANVRLTLASDVIIQAVAAAPRSVPPSFAWLGSPAMACVVPPAAYEMSQEQLRQAPWWQRALGYTPNNAYPEAPGSGLRMHNGIAAIQGPNYALAQQLRFWRICDLIERGLLVSMNMAPACRTESVTKNSTMAAALNGMGNFAPMEAFDADAAKAVMFAMLVSDLRSPGALARAKQQHPLAYISEQSFHGGSWATAYTFESVGRMCYILGNVWPQK